MVSSLSNLINNLSEGIHRIKCKFGHDDKKCETCGIKYKYCDCFLECINFTDNLKSDSHVYKKFCQIKIFPRLVRINTINCLFGV